MIKKLSERHPGVMFSYAGVDLPQLLLGLFVLSLTSSSLNRSKVASNLNLDAPSGSLTAIAGVFVVILLLVLLALALFSIYWAVIRAFTGVSLSIIEIIWYLFILSGLVGVSLIFGAEIFYNLLYPEALNNDGFNDGLSGLLLIIIIPSITAALVGFLFYRSKSKSEAIEDQENKTASRAAPQPQVGSTTKSGENNHQQDDLKRRHDGE